MGAGALVPVLILVVTAAVIGVGGAGRSRFPAAGLAWLGTVVCILAGLRMWVTGFARSVWWTPMPSVSS